MFHCNGWCFTWAVTAVAGRHVCLRTVDPERIWELFDAEGITHYNGAPTVQVLLLDHENAHKLDRVVITTVSGSPPTAELFGRLTEIGIRPIHVYGATELFGPYTICERQEGWDERPADEQARLLGRQGVHYAIAEPVRVVDEQGEEVAADGEALGEVLMRGNNVMTGYFEDPEQTNETLAGGWYHSGDLAVRHPDGYIELRDRKKDIIVSGGENIPTIEVENAVSEHPAVAAAAVVSMPDEKWGERPKAFVELTDGEQASEEEILAFAKERLPGYMRPAAVEVADSSQNIHRQGPKEGATRPRVERPRPPNRLVAGTRRDEISRNDPAPARGFSRPLVVRAVEMCQHRMALALFGRRSVPLSDEERQAAEVDLERIREGGIPLGAEQRLKLIAAASPRSSAAI